MLRLTSRASLIDDHGPCGSSSDVLTQVPLDKPERQIDASRHPGGGPYRAIGNKDAVHLDSDFRKALLQLLSTGPVRRRTPTVEQPSLGQREGSEANGSNAPRARCSLAQQSNCAWCWRSDLASGADEQRVIRVFPHGLGIYGPSQGVGCPLAALGDEAEIVKSLLATKLAVSNAATGAKLSTLKLAGRNNPTRRTATSFCNFEKGSDRPRSSPKARGLAQEKSRRQKLYKQFIDEASKLYADALVHDESEVSALVDMYALIGRMRVSSSDAVIGKAEAAARMILDTYFSPSKTFPELRQLIESRSMDPL
jgi:hypothetical protein